MDLREFQADRLEGVVEVRHSEMAIVDLAKDVVLASVRESLIPYQYVLYKILRIIRTVGKLAS